MTAQQELFEPSTYIDYKGPGYFSILAKPSGQARQKSYETNLLPTILTLLDPSIDTWISQATFNQANRRAVNLRQVGLCFVDLDTYHCKGLAGKPPEAIAALLNLFCSEEGIPAPSLILFSGRGLQAKWLLDQALGKSSLPAWNNVQNGLVRILDNFGADSNAKDICRVLRLVRTVNTKSGEVVRIVDLSGTPDCPARYDFEDLQEIIRERFPEAQPQRARGPRPYTAKILEFPNSLVLANKKLNWDRLCDLQKLVSIRGGVKEGIREVMLFWQLNFLALYDPGKDLWYEAQALASSIDSRWFTDEIYKSTFSTLYRKAREMRAGVKYEYAGKNYPAGYTPRNQTLIDHFSISSTEEGLLKTIITPGERERRRREKRREAGVISREMYLEQSLNNTRPWEAEGISRAWWYKLHRVDKCGLHLAEQGLVKPIRLKQG